MTVNYIVDPELNAPDVADLFRRSTIRRPIDDLPRIGKMIAASDLTVAAFDGDKLVGYARSLTDFIWCCYLSDLAVDVEYQHKGIGKELIRITQEQLSEESMLLLLSAPEAMEYYPKVGFQKSENAWIKPRRK